ncbi:MAG TPA: DUF2935 domain-containing protein, partial [Bacillales bacterium]|nr:DUF2935 domain-containing protein [Bacillales bacterium]
HAGTIEKELEMTEYNLRSKSRQFTKDFEHFYLKAVEMAGFLRANLQRFPALSRFNREVKLEMAIFQEFLQEMEEMEMHKTVLSTFTPLMADHMYREECYYLTKLAEVTELNRPDCHPAKPRVKQ